MKGRESDSRQEYVYPAKVDSSGRIVLPAELRDEMGVSAGDTVIISRDKNGVHLLTFEESLKRAQEYFMKLAPASVVMSEELIKERREEARRE